MGLVGLVDLVDLVGLVGKLTGICAISSPTDTTYPTNQAASCHLPAWAFHAP